MYKDKFRVNQISGNIQEMYPDLVDKIKNCIESSYVNTTSIVEREVGHCNTTYYILDPTGNLVAFFMVNYESIGNKDSVYLGLNGVAKEYKNSGISILLYKEAIKDGLKYQKITGKSLFLYATTATPSVYNSATRFFRNVNPRLDGSYDKSSEMIATQYALRYNINQHNHPFVFKAIARGTQYSISETHRIKRIIDKYDFNLFNELGVNESNGDRLFLVFELPIENDINYDNEYSIDKKLQ